MIDILLIIAVALLTVIIARLFFVVGKLRLQMTVVVKSQLETLNLMGTLFQETRERKENATRKNK
jgi:hypothetical protein